MKKVDRYFKVVETSSKFSGMLFGPQNAGHWPVKDTEPFDGTIDGKMLEVELRYGLHPNYVVSSDLVRIVSPEMKQLLEKYMTDETAVSFYPIKVISKELGDRIHYIMQFNKITEALNPECSIYASAGNVRLLTIPGLDKAKVEGLNFFNINYPTTELYISDEMRRAIIRHKLNKGITFMELPCEYRKTDANEFN